jgi:hypothetical protein
MRLQKVAGSATLLVQAELLVTFRAAAEAVLPHVLSSRTQDHDNLLTVIPAKEFGSY